MAEDAGVFLHARRVAGHFAQLHVVRRVRRLLQDRAVLGEQVLVHALHGLLGPPVVLPGPAQHAPALALDEDLALGIFLAPHRRASGVVGAAVPFAVPRSGLDDIQHVVVAGAHTGRVRGLAHVVVQRRHLAAGVQE